MTTIKKNSELGSGNSKDSSEIEIDDKPLPARAVFCQNSSFSSRKIIKTVV